MKTFLENSLEIPFKNHPYHKDSDEMLMRIIADAKENS